MEYLAMTLGVDYLIVETRIVFDVGMKMRKFP